MVKKSSRGFKKIVDVDPAVVWFVNLIKARKDDK